MVEKTEGEEKREEAVEQAAEEGSDERSLKKGETSVEEQYGLDSNMLVHRHV